MARSPRDANAKRGQRLDDFIPENHETRTLRAPHMAANPYIGHRITVLTFDGRCRCDCGAGPFASATELEAHQHPYRHTVPPGCSR